MKIFIKRTINSETAPKLIKHIKNCEEGFELPETDEPLFVINYGRVDKNSNLNNNIITNKLEQLKILKQNDILVPEVISCSPKKVNKRHLRAFYRGLLPSNIFPLLARKEKHSKGKDIIFLKTRGSLWKRAKRVSKRDFFIKYVPKKAEFRVHVLGDDIANISQKVKSENACEFHPHVWSSERGWTLKDYEERNELYERLKEISIKCARVLGFDFGAIDIGLGEDDKLYIFEMNSAPRLNKIRRRLYAKYFRIEEKKFSANN